MIRALDSLRVLGTGLALAAFAAGLGSAWLWMHSDALWAARLARADSAGRALYAALMLGAPPPDGVRIMPLAPESQALAARGAFAQMDAAPRPAFVTHVPIRQGAGPGGAAQALDLAVVSGDLVYPLADVSGGGADAAAETLGALAQVLASYCSDPAVYASADGGPWHVIDGGGVWGCDGAPTDYRLLAAGIALLALGATLTAALNTAGHFTRFAELLRSRRRLGGPESYDTEGPRELRDIVAAVNAYLENERAQLEQRALVLSGVSHDLGTPATRLRLRAALIEDAELRERLETDIDRMTGMIESVLTYTRAELSAEAPRQISLSSLIEATVADYQDIGRPVELIAAEPRRVEGGAAVLTAKRGRRAVPENRPVLVTARPVSLQRAISNLIDNALKYGRRASVQLEVTAARATIVIEDEGAETSVDDIEALKAPFARGKNAGTVQGFGLGLTIAATVAEQHGGQLRFEKGSHGLRACLEIARARA